MTTKSSPVFVVVAAEAFDERGRRGVVFIRHPARGWEMPGGTIEPGESPIQAAVREFREETGFDLLGPRHLGPASKGPGALVVGRMGPRIHDPEAGVDEWCVVTGWPVLLRLSFPDDPYPETLRRAGFGHLLAPEA